MSRMLAIIAVVGLTLCAALLGGATLLGGDDVLHDPRSMEGLKPLIDLATRKEWRWAGGDTLALDAPMTIRYQPNGKPNVTITGPAEAVDHVRFGEGRITSDAPVSRRQAAKLHAVVSGVPIRKFVVNGGETLQLGHIDQDDLSLYVNGAGTVSGSGKVGHLKLVSSGPGKADLGDLSVGDATVSILGNGEVVLSPIGALNLFIAGNGRIILKTKPASIKRRILGNAVIEMPDSAERTLPPPTPPTPPAPPGTMPVPVQDPVQAQVQVGLPPPGTKAHVLVNGSKNVDLGHIDQDHLMVSVSGSGSVTAQGRVDTLEVNVMGTGNARLGGLKARRVTVNLFGSGNATVAPAEDVKVQIAGSGNVRLTTRPARIERAITGGGRIIEAK
jgi:hypothetical protein